MLRGYDRAATPQSFLQLVNLLAVQLQVAFCIPFNRLGQPLLPPSAPCQPLAVPMAFTSDYVDGSEAFAALQFLRSQAGFACLCRWNRNPLRRKVLCRLLQSGVERSNTSLRNLY